MKTSPIVSDQEWKEARQQLLVKEKALTRFRDGERVFRAYFINNRGDEAMGTAWRYLDLTPLGRQETWEDSPEGYPQTAPYEWWNWHENYDAEAAPDKKWVQVSDAGVAAFRNRDAEAKV